MTALGKRLFVNLICGVCSDALVTTPSGQLLQTPRRSKFTSTSQRLRLVTPTTHWLHFKEGILRERSDVGSIIR